MGGKAVSPCPLTIFLFTRLLQEGKNWISSNCAQNCVCIGGTIECQNFQCPSGAQCQDNEEGSGNCVEISKGAMRKVERVCSCLEGLVARQEGPLVPWPKRWRIGGTTVARDSGYARLNCVPFQFKSLNSSQSPTSPWEIYLLLF